MSHTDTPWWMGGTVYQIYPRSFQDSDGDGIGDLPGITSRLDEVADLGVDAIWLSPIQRSPQADFGYDISDYDDVDPLFGTLDDFQTLCQEAHARGLRVILDGVYNHTSDQHEWFRESRLSRANPRRDWYIWRPGPKPPNNWGSVFGGPAWTLDERTGELYLHSFLPEQPDLNWRNPEVVDAVLASMRHWLDLGLDGFRLDVFNCYFKDQALRSNPRRWDPAGLVGGAVYPFIKQHHLHDRDQPEMMEVLRRMRALVDEQPGRMLVGETLDERAVYDNAARYCGPGRLHMAFHFRLLHSRWDARSFAEAITTWVQALPPGGWPTWVLSNHDFRRHATRWGGAHHGDARSKLAILLATTLRGTPFLYYGEELGMVEGRLSRDQLQDPPGKRFWPLFKGRDGCRTPMQWDSSPDAGFTSGTPWLPVNPDHRSRNRASQREDPSSVLSTYRAALALRRATPALQVGQMNGPKVDQDKILTYRRELGDTRVRVVLNMSAERLGHKLVGERVGRVLLSTHMGGEVAVGQRLDLRAHEGLVLEVE